MTFKERMRLLDEIGFLGTQEGLSPARGKKIEKDADEAARAYLQSLKKRKAKKTR